MTSEFVHSMCWIDLGTTDTETAAGFYTALLGWQVGPPDGAGYRVATIDGSPVAAFGPADDPGPPYWTVYIAVEDVAEAVLRVRAAGGEVVVAPAAVAEAGVAAVVRSADGLPLSL